MGKLVVWSEIWEKSTLTGVYFGEEGEHGEEETWVGECGVWLEERQDAYEEECCIEDVMPARRSVSAYARETC